MQKAKLENNLSRTGQAYVRLLDEIGRAYIIKREGEIVATNHDMLIMLGKAEISSSDLDSILEKPEQFQVEFSEKVLLDNLTEIFSFQKKQSNDNQIKPSFLDLPLGQNKSLEQALKTSNIIAAAVNQEGKLVYFNDLFQNTFEFGSLRRDFDFFEFAKPDVTLSEFKTFEQVIKENKIPTTFSVRSSRNSRVAVHIHTICIRKPDNNIDKIVFVGEDVSDKRRVSEELQKTNAQLKELFDNSYDLIQIFNGEGKFRFVNEAWKVKLGYDKDTFSELTIENVVHEDIIDEFYAHMEASLKGNISERFETVLKSKYGKKVFVSGRINSSSQNGKDPEFRAIFYDITEKTRVEKAQKIYYKIAQLTISKSNINELYEEVYSELNKILEIQNLTIAHRDKDKYFIYPFYKSEHDTPGFPIISDLLASYALETKKPCIIYEDGILRLAEQKKIVLQKNSIPKIWLGVQIKLNGEPIGVLSVHSFKEKSIYNIKDLELIDFVAGQVSLALERQVNQDRITTRDARLKSIFESSTHQIFSVDKKHHYTSYNQNYADAVKSYFGIEPKINQSFVLFNRSLKEKELKKFWKEKFQKAFKGQVVNFRTNLTDLQDNVIWRDVYLNPIILADGTIDEISVISNDITEKVASEQALKSSEEKFRNIFESFQDIYFRCNMDGKITMVSPSVQDMMGLTPLDIIGRDIKEFFESNVLPEEILKELFTVRKLRNLEGRSVVNGKTIQFLCNVRLLYEDGQPVEIEGVARDITLLMNANENLKKAKDIAEKSLKVKERFLANMSHEIRTPMNGIIGMIDLIASTNMDDEQINYVKTIKKSSENLLAILNDILDLSKIEAGKMDLKKTPVSISHTIEKVYDLYSQQARQKNIDLFYYLPNELPPPLMIDETRLIQIISNLTSNAIKFSDGKGNVNIAIRVASQDEEKYKFKIQVKDSGIGISKKNQKTLFTSFNQLDNSMTKTYAGTGLGLAISKELVHAMNGEIGVASTPGLGSTFWFTFEAQIPDPNDLNESIVNENTGISKQFVDRAPKILLVDDNAINRTVASQILTKSGCEVDPASGGQEAIERVKEFNYDLIFMDIQMPVMDGVQATALIKKLNKQEIPPIVAMTAYSMEEDRKRFLSKGLDDYLAKPIQATPLINKVKDWLDFEYEEVKKDLLVPEKTEDLIINQNKLNQLNKYGGKELMYSVLDDFENETLEIIQNCLKFGEVQDFEAVKKELHTLKGNAGTLGIEKVAKCAANMEKKLKENIFTGFDIDLTDLKDCFKDFQQNRKNLVNEQ